MRTILGTETSPDGYCRVTIAAVCPGFYEFREERQTVGPYAPDLWTPLCTRADAHEDDAAALVAAQGHLAALIQRFAD